MTSYQYIRKTYTDGRLSSASDQDSSGDTLRSLIYSSLSIYPRLRADGDNFFVDCDEALSEEDKLTLDSIVENFTPEPDPNPE